ERDEVAVVAVALLEVRAHARAEGLRLPDVDDRPLLVLEEVHARRERERVELLGDDVGEHASRTLVLTSRARRTLPSPTHGAGTRALARGERRRARASRS